MISSGTTLKHTGNEVPKVGQHVLFWHAERGKWCDGVFLKRGGEEYPGIFEGPTNVYNHKNLNGCEVKWWTNLPPAPPAREKETK